VTEPMTETDRDVVSIVASLAPDRMAPVTPQSDLVDDLGYDSPRKMELVATLESHLHQQLPDPTGPVTTVADVLAWVNTHLHPMV
jgi:acyl carrier protein